MPLRPEFLELQGIMDRNDTVRRIGRFSHTPARQIGSMRAVVEELLARDLIVLDRIDGDFFKNDALAGGFGRDIQGKEDDELVRVRAIEKWAGHSLPVEGLVRDPVL